MGGQRPARHAEDFEPRCQNRIAGDGDLDLPGQAGLELVIGKSHQQLFA